MRNTCLLFVVAFFAVVGCSPDSSSENSESATPPNPEEILAEARADRKAGRHEAALEKHVWFHENALRYDPALAGVRLSFALADWKTLANRYPPALSSMKQIRDEAGERVKKNNDDYDAFNDFESLNNKLNEENRTVELFKWLDTNDPIFAWAAYRVAQDALVAAGEFELCGKYIDATDSYKEIRQILRLNRMWAEDGLITDDVMEVTTEIFAYKTALLVAILSRTGRSREASEIADKALQEFEQETFKKQILDAKGGLIPERVY